MMAAVATTITACNKPAQPTNNQDLSVDENLPAGEIPANAEIETLPLDESSATPSGQLQNGYDSPEDNSVGNGN